MVPSFLSNIVADKRRELAERKRLRPSAELEQAVQARSAYDGSGFYDVLKTKSPQPKVIAEVKKASPSRGLIRQDFDLAAINAAYQAADNVVAISVLTEKKHFQGGDDVFGYFVEHNTKKKPLLRKDFIFDPYQVLESRLMGAQAYLLIAALLERPQLIELVNLGLEIGIEPLVEVHDQAELDMALATRARVIGVNSRDLTTFKVDPSRHQLLKQLGVSYARVAESGIESAEYLQELSTYADAALIGTSFMKSPDITSAIKEVTAGAGKKR